MINQTCKYSIEIGFLSFTEGCGKFPAVFKQQFMGKVAFTKKYYLIWVFDRLIFPSKQNENNDCMHCKASWKFRNFSKAFLQGKTRKLLTSRKILLSRLHFLVTTTLLIYLSLAWEMEIQIWHLFGFLQGFDSFIEYRKSRKNCAFYFFCQVCCLGKCIPRLLAFHSTQIMS